MAIKIYQADTWCSKAVRLRDGACVNCGTTETLQAMHIYGRRNRALRWSLDNLITGCAACHRKFTESPHAFIDFCNAYLGEGHMDILREKSRGRFKTDEKIRSEITKHYRHEVQRKEADDEYEIVSYN
jgi:hypothetical protein